MISTYITYAFLYSIICMYICVPYDEQIEAQNLFSLSLAI